MLRLLQFTLLCLGLATRALAALPSHQGSLYPCEGQSIPGVQHLDVALPPEGRNYGCPA